MRLYVAVCNFPYTGLRPAADVQFPELLELGLCSVGLCEVDLDRVLAGSPKLEKLAFVCGRVALTRIDAKGESRGVVPHCRRRLAMVWRGCARQGRRHGTQ